MPVRSAFGVEYPPDGNQPSVVEKTISSIIASQKSGIE